MSYEVKPRPNVQDLGILEGFMNGGGNFPAVQREAYWQPSNDTMSENINTPSNSKP